VDGRALRLRADLSGPRTTTFGWGGVGGRQLSLALLSDLLDNDEQAMRLYKLFEREVVAQLPHDSWTITDSDMSVALAALHRRRISKFPTDPRIPVVRDPAPPLGPSRKPPVAVVGPAKGDAPSPPAAIKVDQELVSDLAYETWEKNGRSDGHALEDWLTAEAKPASTRRPKSQSMKF